jgi:hypothetical protein
LASGTGYANSVPIVVTVVASRRFKEACGLHAT